MISTHSRHPIIETSHAFGIRAVAGAYAARRDADPAFPDPTTMAEHLQLLGEVERAGLRGDLTPLRALFITGGVPRPEPSPHERLELFAELALGWHLVRPYRPPEGIAVVRLFAAMHLLVAGSLPILASSPMGGEEIQGCELCRAAARHPAASLPSELARAMREGVLDPCWIPPPTERGSSAVAVDARPQQLRLAWSASSPEAAGRIAGDLAARGFTVAIDGTRVVGQRAPSSESADALARAAQWGERRYQNRGGTIVGAQRVFGAARSLLD